MFDHIKRSDKIACTARTAGSSHRECSSAPQRRRPDLRGAPRAGTAVGTGARGWATAAPIARPVSTLSPACWSDQSRSSTPSGSTAASSRAGLKRDNLHITTSVTSVPSDVTSCSRDSSAADMTVALPCNKPGHKPSASNFATWVLSPSRRRRCRPMARGDAGVCALPAMRRAEPASPSRRR